MLVGRVVDDEIGDHAQPAVPGDGHELGEVAERAEARVDGVVVGDVVAVVAVGGRVERHQPDAGDPEPGEVVDVLGESAEVADAVAVGVGERLHVEAVDDGVLPPEIRRGGDVQHQRTDPLAAAATVGRARRRAGTTCSPKTSMKRSCR